jgi:ABC-2 type transport system permease protein
MATDRPSAEGSKLADQVPARPFSQINSPLDTFGLYLRLLSIQIRSQLQYRVAYLIELFTTGLITVFEFGSLALVFERFGSIQGWSLGEVAFLYSLVEISFGLMDLFFSGFDPGRFSQHVRLGTFDQLLLRPVSITVQVLGSELVLRRIGRVFVGAVIFASALGILEIHWTPVKIAILPTIVASMFAFFGGLFIIGATLTFWTVESVEVMNIFTYGGGMLISYPMHIYPDWIRRFFTFVLPAIFLNYYPALFILDKPDPLNFPDFAPLLAPAAGSLVLLISLGFWRFGIRHYKSTGS